MIDLELKIDDFEARAKELDGQIDQLPFALANALNDAAFKTRRVLVDQTWPGAVKERNKSFIGAALRVDKAMKHNLVVAIVDKLGRANLALHAKGGTRVPQSRLAIPDSKNLGPRRTSKGVPQALRPRSLPNSFRKGDAIYQRVGSKKKPRLKLMYILRPYANIRKDVPFVEDFRRFMQDELTRAFPAAMARAMATRRR